MDKIEQRLHRRSRLIQLIDGLFGGRQADFAAAAKKNPTQVNHWISGHRNPNGDTCRDVEKELGLPNNWFDSTTPLEEIFQTTLSPSDGSGAFLRTASEYLANQTTPLLNSSQAATDFVANMRPIMVWEHTDDLPEGDYVFIPRLDVQLSAGNGTDQVSLDLVKETPQAFRADWIRDLRIKPAKLASMRAKGDSMEPRIFDGDAVVVDTGDTTVIDGKVYAVWYEGGERIKRLYRLPGNGIRIASDNASRYPSIDLNEDQSQHVRVLGRVRHVASTKGL